MSDNQVIVLGDLHFGVRKGEDNFLNYQINYLRSVYEFARDNGIDTIFQTGDFFDVRQHINTKVLHRIQEFYETISDWCIKTYCIVGNHDIFYRDSNHVNSISKLQEIFPDQFYVVVENEQLVFGDKTILFLSWINKNNIENQLKAVNDSFCDYVFGHLELNDFAMYKNNMAKSGMNRNLFSRFERVISGHYHTISEIDNVLYVGTPYHLTWADFPDGNDRGFWIWDLDDNDVEIVRNETSLFDVFYYDKDIKYDESDVSHLEGKVVEIIVEDQGDTKKFNQFKKLVASIKTIQCDYSYSKTAIGKESEKIVIDESKFRLDFANVLEDYIDKLENISCKDRLVDRTLSVLQRALTR